ncbi:hypothetical protein RI129_008526 [Pyrocoelia pectoralis]|uniref:Uncharacterized protein n=1 Tax=Pyrocoelia pectoralis TaxID=417401 RepID=A0AAN7VEB1_9COLE
MEVKDESENSEDEELNKHIISRRHLYRRPTQLKLEGNIWNATESAEKFVQYLLTEKTKLLRHPTTLKMEGDMEIKTESRDKYIPYESQIRPALLKTDTNLHLEGIMAISTENRDKFLPLELLPRPPLSKRNTNLHMEGDMHFGSENRDKFLPLELLPRPPLTKRSTNLHLEGDMDVHSEYKDIFVEYKDLERIRPTFPIHNLKSDGFLQTETEKASKFVKHDIQPVIPSLRNYEIGKRINLGDEPIVKNAEYKSKFVRHPRIERSAQKPKENLKLEGTFAVSTENNTQFVAKPASKSALKKTGTNLHMEGKIDLNPEYKNAYVNFYKDANGKIDIVKDPNSQRARRQHLKSEGDMETNPEYKSAFVDFPRQRPSNRKPDGHMHMEGNISNMTEKRAQFIEHPMCKPHLLKRQTELKLEGPFECYPEYRRAYIDYVMRDNAAERQPRLPESLNPQRRRIFDDGIEEPSVTAAETTLAVDNNRRHRSLSPTPKSSGKNNLSKVETRLFGPKLPHYSYSKSAPRPKPPVTNMHERLSRASRRFGSTELVEDLAYVPPIDSLTLRIARYGDEDKKRDKHSFVVLGNFDIQSCTDTNNNNRFGSKQLFKEQKWMPSWYSTSSNK